MTIIYSKKFRKHYKKLLIQIRSKFKERRNVFLSNQFDPILNSHPLNPPHAGCRSINITGDYRAIFYHEREDIMRFIDIDTHHNLFGT